MLFSLPELVRGSTDRAFSSRNSNGSFRSSPRSSGMSCRQNILCRVFVPVVAGLTRRAIPLSNGQRQRPNNVTTDATSFTRRKESINQFKFFSVPNAFVLQHTSEHRQGSIRQATCQAVILKHPTQIKILNTDDVKSSNDVSSYFVQVVSASISDVGMDLSNPKLCSFPAIASFDSSRQDTLRPHQFPFGILQMFRVGNSLTIRQSSQSRNTNINSDGFSSLRKFANRLIQCHGHEVSFSTILGYRDRTGITCERPGQVDMQLPKLCNKQVSISRIPFKSRSSILSGLLSSLLFERGIVSSFFKKVFICGLKMAKGLLNRNTRYFIQPGVLRLCFKDRKSTRRGVVVDCLSTFETVTTEFERPIIDVSARSEGSRKLLPLLISWVHSKFIFRLHKNSIPFVRSLVKLINLWERQFLPGLKSGVSLPKRS